MLERVELLLQLRDFPGEFLPHGTLSVRGLLHNKIFLLYMLEFFGKGLLFEVRFLPRVLFDVCPLSQHNLDLIKRKLKLLVERVHLHKVLVRAQLQLALLQGLPHSHLLLLQILDFLQSLVLQLEKRFLSLLDLLLQRLLLSFELVDLLHAFHRESFRIRLHVLQIHLVQVCVPLLLLLNVFKLPLGFSKGKLLAFFLSPSGLAVFLVALNRGLLSAHQVLYHLFLALVLGQVSLAILDCRSVDFLDRIDDIMGLIEHLSLEKVEYCH